MIAIIEIPHQRKARLHWYAGEVDVIEAAIEYAAESDRDEPVDFQSAIDCLADDWHGRLIVQSAADVADVAAYTGHQEYVVAAMLDELREEFTSLPRHDFDTGKTHV